MAELRIGQASQSELDEKDLNIGREAHECVGASSAHVVAPALCNVG